MSNIVHISQLFNDCMFMSPRSFAAVHGTVACLHCSAGVLNSRARVLGSLLAGRHQVTTCSVDAGRSGSPPLRRFPVQTARRRGHTSGRPHVACGRFWQGQRRPSCSGWAPPALFPRSSYGGPWTGWPTPYIHQFRVRAEVPGTPVRWAGVLSSPSPSPPGGGMSGHPLISAIRQLARLP